MGMKMKEGLGEVGEGVEGVGEERENPLTSLWLKQAQVKREEVFCK